MIDDRVITMHVCCDECGRWEMFENAGLGDVYDEAAVHETVFFCRMCLIEKRYNDLSKAFDEVRLEQFRLRTRIENLTDDCLGYNSSCLERVEELRSSVLSIEQRLVIVDSEWPVACNSKIEPRSVEIRPSRSENENTSVKTIGEDTEVKSIDES